GASAAQEIDVAQAAGDPGLLLGAVTDRDADAMMPPLGDAQADRHLRRLVLQAGHVDVDEVEQLETVEAPLALDDATALERIARTEGELAADDPLGDAL